MRIKTSSWLMIIECAGLHYQALNPCKKYKILMQDWICMKCPQTRWSVSPLVSILNMHELVETVHERAIDFEIPRLTVNVHFPCNTWIYRELKCRMDWSYGKPYNNYLLARSFNFWNNLLPMEQLNFTWLILKFPDLLWYTPQKQRLKIIWYASEA